MLSVCKIPVYQRIMCNLGEQSQQAIAFIKLFLIINSYMIPEPQFQLKFTFIC